MGKRERHCEDEWADRVTAHIAEIKVGRCSITEEAIAAETEASRREVLEGLRVLHEQLVPQTAEREEVENALRESEDRYRRLSEAAFEGIAIHDGERMLDANGASFASARVPGGYAK